jgi:hypothetical protein
MPRSIPIVLAATALATGLGACGGDGARDGEAARGTPAGLRDAGISFARCMREHGIDMPDPRTDENGVVIVEQGGGDGEGAAGKPPSRRFRAAEEACRKHLRDVKPPALSPEQAREFRQQALAHARCMREHGVDFPDPRVSEDGGAVVDIGPGSGLDPRSPAFRKAQEACRGLAGGPGAGGAPAGSGS